MSESQGLTLPSLFVLFIVAVCLFRLSSTALVLGLPLPPGPRASWIGIVKLPKEFPWLVYSKWRASYGDLIYVSVLGNPVLVLNSYTAASDLLEKKGSIYSSRPARAMAVDLIGWDWSFSVMPYGKQWKRHRNFFHKYFKPQDAQFYQNIQMKETHTLLRNLIKSPEGYLYHVRRTGSAIILNLVYGHQVAEQGDEFIDLAKNAVDSIARAGIFGTYLVDYFPILKFVPAWMPFATFKRQALKWRIPTREILNRPFEMVKQQMRDGDASPSFVSQELENRLSGEETEDEDVIKSVAAAAYAGGAETSLQPVLSFFLVMSTFTDMQIKAQAELDRVTNGTRLPTLADKCDLPLIESMVYELLRWNPALPLGLAHCTTEDDEYKGYQIPKGTTVLPNVWAILHDPELYPDPEMFIPDRFVDSKKNAAAGINEIPEIAFGFGRRICPGRWLALDFIFIVVASILSVYDVRKAVDENCNEIEPKVEFTSHLISHPKPFRCRVKPRSRAALSLIERTET